MLIIASEFTAPASVTCVTLIALVSCVYSLGHRVLLRKPVRGDDLVTSRAEKNESLVSAILSVKYSSSALLCCPQADAASGQGQRRRWAAHGTV